MPTRRPARCAAASAARTTRRRPSRPTRTIGVSGGGAASPNILRTLSVGQAGRKSETTLGHHTPPQQNPHILRRGMRISSSSQRGTPDAGDGQRRRRQGRHAPSRRGGGRHPEIRGLGLAPPAPDREAERAGGLGRELQPARSRHGEPRHFGDDGAQSRMPQTLLQSRRAGLSRRRTRHRRRARARARLGRAPARTDRVASRTTAPCRRCAPRRRRRTGRRPRRPRRHCRHPATSCSAPRSNPPSGRIRSIAARPKGRTAR